MLKKSSVSVCLNVIGKIDSVRYIECKENFDNEECLRKGKKNYPTPRLSKDRNKKL